MHNYAHTHYKTANEQEASYCFPFDIGYLNSDDYKSTTAAADPRAESTFSVYVSSAVLLHLQLYPLPSHPRLNVGVGLQIVEGAVVEASLTPALLGARRPALEALAVPLLAM